jgi:hypothetical protein
MKVGALCGSMVEKIFRTGDAEHVAEWAEFSNEALATSIGNRVTTYVLMMHKMRFGCSWKTHSLKKNYRKHQVDTKQTGAGVLATETYENLLRESNLPVSNSYS